MSQSDLSPAAPASGVRWRRNLLFALLYFSEGAPIGFIWWRLPTKLRLAQVPVEEITALIALVGLPWAFKFVWAPLIDVARGPRWSRRAWILLAQAGMIAALAPLAWLDLRTDFRWVYGLLMLHAACAATQDVGIDALAIQCTPVEERGALNAWMTAGKMAGRVLFSAGALYFEEILGERRVLLLLMLAIGCSAVVLLWARLPAETHSVAGATDQLRTFLKNVRRVLKERRLWFSFAHAGLAACAFETVGAVAGPLLVDRGLDQQGVAVFFLWTPAATVVGGLVGGWWSDRLGRLRAVGLFQAGFALAVVALAARLQWGPSGAAHLFGLLMALYGMIGLYLTASYALYMDLTDPALSATQFTGYMSLTNVCESWSARAGGMLIASLGYAGAFGCMALGSLSALGLLVPLGPLLVRHKTAPTQKAAVQDE